MRRCTVVEAVTVADVSVATAVSAVLHSEVHSPLGFCTVAELAWWIRRMDIMPAKRPCHLTVDVEIQNMHLP